MARPAVPNDLDNGQQAWDANINDMKDQTFATPFPTAQFADFASLPSAAAFDRCHAVTLAENAPWFSDGVNWLRGYKIAAGVDGVATSFGAKAQLVGNMQDSGALGAVAAFTFVAMVPAGKRLMGIAWRILVAPVGGNPIDVGDGTDVDRFGAAVSPAAGSTGDMGDATADPGGFSVAAQDVVFTSTVGNLNGAQIRCVAFYDELTAPTS